jgi:methionyl-tRNA formyltransferase
MEAKPDAGDVVGQLAVPILPDDTAREVLAKVTVAAEIVLDAALPGLLAGTAPRIRQDLASGSYFRGRTPEDGRIDWRAPASSIHDLVRAVAPPYPGASTTLAGKAARVLATRVLDPSVRAASPRLELAGDRLVAWCGGGGMLHVKRLEVAGREITPESFLASFGLCVPFPT